MKTTSIVLIALVMALTGCTTFNTVGLVDRDPAASTSENQRLVSVALGASIAELNWPYVSYAKLNRLARGKVATVLLADGRELKVGTLQVTPDSTSWLDPETGRFESVATAEIQEMRFVRHGKGALEGLGMGLLVGAVVGGALGASARCEGWCFVSQGELALIGGAVLGGIGALVGAPIGAAVGSKEIFHFGSASPPKVVTGRARRE